MSLFPIENQNLLPFDGEATYYGPILDTAKASGYFHNLMANVNWQSDKVKMFGKTIVTKRKTAWYGDKPFQYTYSKTTKTALPWTQELIELKILAEGISGETYNSCLLNLYHDGNEGMGWHSDDEKEILTGSAIASLSLGSERKFSLKHKSARETRSIVLENGSLLVMKGETQRFWLHSVPKSVKVDSARINLTFRTICCGVTGAIQKQ